MTIENETQVMTKQEAIQEVYRVFKGNMVFISCCIGMIASTPNFKGIGSCKNEYNIFGFEKLLRITIDSGNYGFKQLHYRKGKKNNILREDIHDYSLIHYDDGETEEYKWDA